MSTALASDYRPAVKTTLPPSAYPRDTGPQPLATFLALFSVGLGLAEAFAPKQMANLTGVRSTALLRGYGFREMLSGLGILKSEQPAFWLWSRVGGDAIDLATLASAYSDASPDDRTKILASAAAVLGVTALDVLCALQHSGGR